MKKRKGMIYREGGCLDERHGSVWVRIEYDGQKNDTAVRIYDRKGGRTLAENGRSGPYAKDYYDRLNNYFFGSHE